LHLGGDAGAAALAGRLGAIEHLGDGHVLGAAGDEDGLAVDAQRALGADVAHLAELVADAQRAGLHVAVHRTRGEEADAQAHHRAIGREARELLDAPLALHQALPLFQRYLATPAGLPSSGTSSHVTVVVLSTGLM